ncbi:ABC transporter permease [Gryllotalpicola ginsengisoli]|uniref:ABC transporter permease n=1 Tax=Gryllotalpicola ginsengisoli TaxID=444608 RepID=UPI0003B4643E|nr:ABC transporter permease [Gryllotalpicola ginsengisoli]
MNYLKEIWASRELLANLTLRDIRGQYKRTIIGRLWSLVNPLAAMLIYTLVFSFIIRVQPDPGDPSGLDIFAVWLLCGLLPWNFFAMTVQTSMGSIIANTGLVQKVYFNRLVLPLASVGAIGFNWLFEMGVLLVTLVLCGAFVWPWIPLVALTMVILAAFATGIGLMLSIANVHFRDTQYLIGIVMQIWMYLTPVIYPINLMQAQSDRIGTIPGTGFTLIDLYRLNPMERFVEIFRNLLYDNRWPDGGTMLYVTVAALLSLVLGLWVFRSNERKLAEAL